MEKLSSNGIRMYIGDGKRSNISQTSTSLGNEAKSKLKKPYVDFLPNLTNNSSHNSRPEADPMQDIFRFREPNTNIDYAINGFDYIFMTKPDLNIAGNIEKDNFLNYLKHKHPIVLTNLVQNASGPIVPFVTNLYDKFELDDVSLDETVEAESWRGYGQRLPTHFTDTVNGGTFTISYAELQKPLITYFHKVWIEYIEKVRFGFFNANYEKVSKKILDYTASLYYFMLEPDGETIRMWAKYTGITPKSIPYSAFSADRGRHEPINISVQYLYSYREMLNPLILHEFNTVMSGTNISENDEGYEEQIGSEGTSSNFQMGSFNSDYKGKEICKSVSIKQSPYGFKLVFE